MKDAVLFWRKYKPNGSKYILTTGRSLRIKSKDPVFVCINPTITNIPDLPTGLTDKNAKQWLYSFRVSVVARVALKKLEGKIPERGKKALRRRLLEGLTQAIEHFVILLERIS